LFVSVATLKVTKHLGPAKRSGDSQGDKASGTLVIDSHIL
jgi:hypothetical protein